MGKHSSEDRVDKKETPPNRKASAAPAGKPHVTLGHDRRKISETKFVCGKGETEVGLREGRNAASKGGSHIQGRVLSGFDGDEGTFVKIDDQARGSREVVENSFEVGDMFRDSPNDNEGIISILENGAGKVINQRVEKKTVSRCLEKHLLKNIRNDVEKEGEQRTSLPQSSAALNPVPRNAVEQHRSLTSAVNHFDPITPERGETFSFKNPAKSIPTDGVKGLTEIQLEYSLGGIAPVASLDNISGVNKVFSNGAARDKPSLVRVNQVRNMGPEAKGKAFGMNF
jgi:hypothetical protein